MSDLLKENTCRVGQLAKTAKVRPETIWRWCKKGVLVNGKRVHLEHVMIGGTIISSEEALKRFSDKCSICRPVMIEGKKKQNPKSRAEEAKKELDKILHGK